ncbi:MAG: ankyrin repeat domain-containing protein [Myxococcota bacterium]
MNSWDEARGCWSNKHREKRYDVATIWQRWVMAACICLGAVTSYAAQVEEQKEGVNDEQVKQYNSALLKAAADGDVEEVRKYLNLGANIECQDKNDMRPLHHATKYGHHEVVKVLLKVGANPNAVAENPQVKFLKYKNTKWTPLHLAAFYGYVPTLHALIKVVKETGTLDPRDVQGRTPLHTAADGQNTIAAVLINAGANIKTKRNDGT